MPRSWNASPAISDPRVVIDTSGLSPEATRLANLLAEKIREMKPDEIEALLLRLDRRGASGDNHD